MHEHIIFAVDIFDKKNHKILQNWHADKGSRGGLDFETRVYDINGKWLKNYAPFVIIISRYVTQD